MDEGTQRLAARAAGLAHAGVDFLLLREKLLSPEDLIALTRLLVAECAGTRIRIVVPASGQAGGPASVQAALAGGAHGVHLSAGAGTPVAVRDQMPGVWVSVSCHTVEQVERARREGADAVLFAPVFGKSVGGVKVVDGAGLGRLREACAAAAPVPVFALGGVDESNADACVASGAAGVAGIRMFFGDGRAAAGR